MWHLLCASKLKEIVFIRELRISSFGVDSEDICVFYLFRQKRTGPRLSKAGGYLSKLTPHSPAVAPHPPFSGKTSHNTWRKGWRGNCIWYIINRPYRTGTTRTADTQHQTTPLSVIHDPNPFMCQWYNRLAFRKTAASHRGRYLHRSSRLIDLAFISTH